MWGFGMTEKRFVGGPYGFYDRYKGDRWLWSEWEYIIEIMNNLDTKARERSKALSKLQKENEQLKQTIETQNFNYENAKGIIHSSEHQIQQLQDENEQLKNNIKEAYQSERTMIGKSVLKQLIEQME